MDVQYIVSNLYTVFIMKIGLNIIDVLQGEVESYGAEDDIVAADLDMHQLILNSEQPKSVIHQFFGKILFTLLNYSLLFCRHNDYLIKKNNFLYILILTR